MTDPTGTFQGLGHWEAFVSKGDTVSFLVAGGSEWFSQLRVLTNQAVGITTRMLRFIV